MKLSGLIAIFTFGVLPGLQASPIELTATNISFSCSLPCGFVSVSGPNFEAQLLSGASALGDTVALGLDGYLGSALTVGNTTYGASSIISSGPTVVATMTSTTSFDNEWLSSGPATVSGDISVCFVSAVPGGWPCTAGSAFAIINLPGLSGTFSELWSGWTPYSNVDGLGGSLSATMIPEPLTAGIAFAGLLLLVAYTGLHRRAQIRTFKI